MSLLEDSVLLVAIPSIHIYSAMRRIAERANQPALRLQFPLSAITQQMNARHYARALLMEMI